MSIYESGRPIQHAYFPTTAIVSLLYETEDGDSAEIAIVGNDGVVGISLFLGGGRLVIGPLCRVLVTAIDCPAKR
ncbi:cyclic nucleotide-binding domain-containing protein [Acidithiobacillus ferrivorans]|uniref:hypothetical protein n=1 Tax=Acidithiobacillus ferrivorans TaxID=160808 RepID=UPI001CBC6778|nr:hypothetical protein [Acidithiobacillus ferrivorans]